MKKYRIKFTKTDKMKFIGHLDLLTLFQRAMKRAKLPIGYSQGFNPHQLMSFAIPLSLGMSSIGEYMDIQMEEIDTSVIKDGLNGVMPNGLEILSVRELAEGEKNCAAIIEAAIYEVELDRYINGLSDKLTEIMTQDELTIERTSKRVTKEVDIKPDIYDIKDITEDGNSKLRMLIATGSQRNLKPDLVLEYIYRYLGMELEKYKIKTLRLDLLKREGESFVSL